MKIAQGQKVLQKTNFLCKTAVKTH